MTDIDKRFAESLRTGFIDHSIQSDRLFRPQLVVNSYERHEKVLTSILSELISSEEFLFSVAFITSSGLATLLNTFLEMQKLNIHGKIITTNYLYFTDPKALEKLLLFSNIEVRAYTEGNFHPKGYIFRKTNYWSVIIGSSNITQDALSVNKEWNIKLLSCFNGELIRTIKNEFFETWERATPVTPEWIKDYSNKYIVFPSLTKPNTAEILAPLKEEEREIIPNKIQQDAVCGLNRIRKNGAKKGLVISATGTGKTYLAAFDCRHYGPKKCLFLAHREAILRKTEESFRDVMGNEISTGFYIGSQRDLSSQYTFGMIQTITRDDAFTTIDPSHFDYIIIDEAHRSGADSYKKILDYFKPNFLLGLTATPERTDGFDVYSLFDHNIAYEIRLQHALELDMLCPFHYFGISDLAIDGIEINDLASFSSLTHPERLKHIVSNIEVFRNNSEKTRGLIFCSRNEEASSIAHALSNLGHPTIALSGENKEQEREDVINHLESGKIEYIITVDIFNEGIDIPCVNQIVMLRPTQSAIIFVQQLGRGLRKAKGKDYLTVIDFIGNYTNNYMIPIALFGDTSLNRDNLRKLISSGSACIPGSSTIDFDNVSKERIFSAITNAPFNRLDLLKEEYKKVKFRLGRIPELNEFIENDSVDPSLFIEYSRSYPAFLNKLNDGNLSVLSKLHIQSLEFVSLEIARGLRPHEIEMLELLIKYGNFSRAELEAELVKTYGVSLSNYSLESAYNILTNCFFKAADRESYGNISYCKGDEGKTNFEISGAFSSLLQNEYYLDHFKQALELGKRKYLKRASSILIDGFSLYEKYSRKDACKILNWPIDEASTIYGYKIQYKTTPYSCPIFVTYKKSDNVKDSINYDDIFIDNLTFSWMTRNCVRLDSKESIIIMDWQNNNIRIPLFIKKNDDEGRDFYYMGDVEPIRAEQQEISTSIKVLPIVNILFHMKHAVRQDIFNYLENAYF